MLVKSFLVWMDKAPVRERAEAVALLAHAYLSRSLGGDNPAEVEAALSAVLDDPSPLVRRALAMNFADRIDAPRHIVLSLAADQAEVSGLLIARSPLLTEADLIDLATTGERLALVAIALRHDTTPRIAQAIVERGDFDSVFALVGNGHSEIPESAFLAIAAQFGQIPRLREAMLARASLPGTARHALMLRVAESLGGYVGGGGFLNTARRQRVLDETMQTATVTIARRTGDALPDFVAHLREKEFLTPALLLRSVLGGDTSFIAVALADICEMEPHRVRGLIRSRSNVSISALLRRAGIPGFLEAALTAAIRAAAALPASERRDDFCLAVVRAAQAECFGSRTEDGVRLIALLRRFEAEAARNDSRRIAGELRRELGNGQALDNGQTLNSLLPPDIGPEMLRLSGLSDEAAPEAIVEMPVNAEEATRNASAASRKKRIGRARGLVLDEPIPDLRTLIEEWKAEREAADRKNGIAPVRSEIATSYENQNDKPGRSRVA